MHYQFEEDSSLPKEAIEVLVRSGKYDQAVQDVLDYLARFNQENGSFTSKNGYAYRVIARVRFNFDRC